MDLPEIGNRIFLYVNGKGIVAVGQIIEDSAIQKDTVFGSATGDEYHREFQWTHKVDPSHAVTSCECSQWGYNLPVRCTIGKMGEITEWQVS